MAVKKDKEEWEEHELRIKRAEIPIYVEPGVTRIQYAITFWSDTIRPMTVFIWKDEWSPEKEREAIAKKIQEELGAEVETLKIRLRRSRS